MPARNPDLFWGIKGGGGGSLGVVTRLTLRTHDLPEFFGAVFMTIKATSDAAFRRLIGRVVAFYSESLFNPHWGEQIAFRPGNVLAITMVFQGLDQQQAEAIWRPFFDWLAASPQDFSIESEPMVVAVPARGFWDPAFSSKSPAWCSPTTGPARPRPTCSGRAIWGSRDRFCTAISRHGCPPRSSQPDRQASLADALFAATPAMGRVPAPQQGSCGRTCRRDRGGAAIPRRIRRCSTPSR